MKHATSFAVVLLLSGGAVLAQNDGNEAQQGGHDLGATTESFTDTDGATLYRRACSGCHGPDGGGAYGAAAYPALAGNARMGSARYPINLMIEGNGAMPSFADWLNDDQIAAVANFLRSNLGNDYEGEVTADEVAQMREEFADLDGG
ncbi:cytochrome c [uncultured Marivita sp.]|uniref:c-type cytochrome n=1 Tax=uncultured Marivita sp. TaxID=888080 RepID=UPI00262B9282|nr:cytochrome c [uncultured Marivita sp.]